MGCLREAEAIQELQARLLENAGRIVTIGEIGIDPSFNECTLCSKALFDARLQEDHKLYWHCRDLLVVPREG